MNASKLYEQLVTGIADAILDEAYTFKQGKIQGIRIAADEAGPRRSTEVKPRDPRDISDATRAEHIRLKTMLDTNTATRKDGTTFPMPKGLRDKVQSQFDAIQTMIGASPVPTGREAAAAKLDSIMIKPERSEQTLSGVDAFHALFASA